MAEQLFQVSLKAVTRNEQGKVLLQAHQQADGRIEMWDLPGGRLDPGEGIMDGLLRELREEISLDRPLPSEPKFIMNMISNLQYAPEDHEAILLNLLIIAYEVTLPAEFMPVSGETGSIINWETPATAAELLNIKFPTEFCDYIAQL